MALASMSVSFGDLLEDRITKHEFARAATTDVPRDLPFVPEGHQAKFKLITRGAEVATAGEIEVNSRARSVRLRVVERLAA